ncbi:DNA adenine methylase, partial [Porphyromonas somerae]
GATLLFAKEPAEGEVINDINMHLVNFYNTLQLDYDALKAKIDSTLHARDMHAHASHILAYPEFFSHVDRAWAVWALSKMSFASMLDGTFGYDFSGGVAKKVRNAKEEFCQHLANRLEHVTIESRHAFEVIETYDSPETYHFVDPPYVNSDCGHYEGVFGNDDLGHLLDLL